MRLSRILLTAAALTCASGTVQCGGAASPVEELGRDAGLAEAAVPAEASIRGEAGSDAARPVEDAPTGRPLRDGGRFPSDADGFPARDADAACPASAPEQSAECHAMATCAYDGLICTCPHHTQGDASRAWSCFSAPVQVDGGTCPGTQPHSHGVCTIEGLNCRYGRVQCFCGGSSNADDAVWDCR